MRHRTLQNVGMAMMLAWGVAAGAAGGDWFRWRGPAGTGISEDSNWDPGALVGQPRVVWKANVGNGYSAVSIKDGRLFTMGNEGDVDVVHCLRTDSGETVWTRSYPCKPGSYPGPRATPFVDGDLVYAASRQGDVLCLEARTGKVKWKRDISSEFGARPPTWGHGGSPCVEGRLLILNGGKSGLALDKTTGRKVWASATGIGNYATPVLATIKGVRCAAIMGMKELSGVVVKSGRVLWSFPWEESKYDVNAADPIISGTRVFVSSGYGKGCVVFDVASGRPEILWQNGKMRNHFSSCVELGGYLYGIDGNTGGGSLACLALETGEEMWRANLGFGSLIAAAGKLIVLNESGKLFVAKAGPEAYEQIATCNTMLAPRCWTAPVLCQGRLYCRNHKGDLVCIDVGKRKREVRADGGLKE